MAFLFFIYFSNLFIELFAKLEYIIGRICYNIVGAVNLTKYIFYSLLEV